jgi:hypothetical protein
MVAYVIRNGWNLKQINDSIFSSLQFDILNPIPLMSCVIPSYV